jgi:ferritin
MEIRKFRTEQGQTQIQQPPRVINPTEGVMTPSKLNDEVVSLLLERLKDEYTAHYYYRAAANWCKNKNYKKAASYFEEEASSELDHAKKLQEYMDDWNVDFQIPSTTTEHEFENLVDIVNQAYQMEYGLLQSYNQSSAAVFVKDLSSFDFLQELRKIQNDSVIEYSDLLNALMLIDYNDKFQLLYFEQTYF